MTMTCTVCRSGACEEINKALITGVPLRAIAEQYGLTKSSLQRHKDSCLPESLVKARDAEQVANSDELLKVSQGLLGNAIRILKDARAMGNDELALRANREAVRSLELHARLQGQVIERVRQESINMNLQAGQASDGVVFMPVNGRDDHQYKDLLNKKIDQLVEYHVAAILGGEPISFANLSRADWLAMGEALRILREACQKAGVTVDTVAVKDAPGRTEGSNVK